MGAGFRDMVASRASPTQRQKKVTDQEREPLREYLERESHYVWGKRYLLKVTEKDAAPKPRECLEHIVVYEMAHLLEQTHNSRFTALMDLFLPGWRYHREVLNRLPVRQY
jgi:predicted metal-dependent hydrolase